MVFEDFFNTNWAEKRTYYSLLLGVFFTLLSFATSYLLFKSTPNLIGISTILFTVILIVPTVEKIFSREEKYEAKEKLGFFRKHEHIIDFFLYFFVGVFITFFIISLLIPNLVFSENQLYDLSNTGEFTMDAASKNLPPPPPAGVTGSHFLKYFNNNMYILLISFLLSLFYGAGALFLITLNGSIFASALSAVIRTNLPSTGFISVYSFTLCNLGIMFFHMIPEVLGYLLAAIAGGVLSQAFVREKIGSKSFWAVLIDSLLLIAASIVVIFLAAIIESEFSFKLFQNNVCVNYQKIILIGFILLLVLIAMGEYLRKYRFRIRLYKA